MEISYTPSVQAIDGLSDPGTSVQGISLANSNANYVPQLSEEGAAQVQDAISAITANNKAVGFAFIDLQTGSGYVYNLDQRVYGASSFKSHVLIYGCQQALETGKTSISRVNSSAQDAIINSDNTSYYRMRNAFDQVECFLGIFFAYHLNGEAGVNQNEIAHLGGRGKVERHFAGNTQNIHYRQIIFVDGISLPVWQTTGRPARP